VDTTEHTAPRDHRFDADSVPIPALSAPVHAEEDGAIRLDTMLPAGASTWVEAPDDLDAPAPLYDSAASAGTSALHEFDVPQDV